MGRGLYLLPFVLGDIMAKIETTIEDNSAKI
jgi:hypothetical protein